MSLINKVKVINIEKIKSKLEEMKPKPYDFKEYTNIDDMRGYIGFITSQGTFYRVRKIGSADGGHGEWAYAYLDTLNIRGSLDLNQNFLRLLNDEQFNFTLIVESRIPDSPLYFIPGINGLTEEQVSVINELTYSKELNEDLVISR